MVTTPNIGEAADRIMVNNAIWVLLFIGVVSIRFKMIPQHAFPGECLVSQFHISHHKIAIDNTGQPVEKVSKDTDRDFIMTAEEAVAYGVIDEVITARGSAALEAVGAA